MPDNCFPSSMVICSICLTRLRAATRFRSKSFCVSKSHFSSAVADGELAGCGGIKLHPDYGEVKRMYVRPSYRGRGLGKAMLDHLAGCARRQGLEVLRLETGIYQVEAIGLYERYGFQRRAPFSDYKVDPMSLYFEKAV